MENHFLNDLDWYTRDLNLVHRYIEDAATYLHKRTGKPLEVCRDYVKRTCHPEKGTLPIKDPECLVLTRHTRGNREKEVIRHSQYLADIVDNDRTLSPSGVVFINKDDKPSIHSEFIDVNIERRSKSKQEKFEAEQRNDTMMYDYKENEQTSFKISNNSLSGGQASGGTMLLNVSAHPSLTSTCRIGTSYGNAITEKFLFGNRHYWCPEIVRANIVSLINSTDFDKLEQCITHYQLNIPTVDETIECIFYSLRLYYKNTEQEHDLVQLIASLSPLERATVVYTQDLYHLRKLNDGFVREMMDRLSAKTIGRVDDPDKYISAMDEDTKVLVSLLCGKELAGTSIKKIKKEDPTAYQTVATTAKAIMETVDDYALLIKALWSVNTTPPSVGYIRNSLRRGVLTSDTDSTIFTCQDWTQWFTGKLDFSEKSKAISYATVYLDTQLISHILAMTSAGMGVRKRELHVFSMKNEFIFPTFVLTGMSKHYFAYQSAQEGNVFTEFKTEVKGVNLKDSKTPPHVIKDFHETLKWVMDEVIEKGNVSIQEVMQHVSFMEKEIERSVREGDSFYLKNAQVKDPSAYTNPESSPYTHYKMWEAVFAEKYGHAPEPPYAATSISVNFQNKTKILNWVEKVKGSGIDTKMVQWMTTNNKKGMSTLLVPKVMVQSHGIPEEIIEAMDLRKLIYNTTKHYYILLESLGLYMVNDNLTRLVSDNVTPKPRAGYKGANSDD